MPRTVGIGIQDFEQIIANDCFYVDKTHFIKEWWESNDSVTLITRPRRFGKTLTMSMLEHFFSLEYKEQGDLFSGLSIWKEQKYRDLQGTYPVINISFATVKEQNYETAKRKIQEILVELYAKNVFLKSSDLLTDKETEYFDRVSVDMDDSTASLALHHISDYLHRYYGKKVIILLDEYDTPMQEAYINGYWNEMAAYTRNLFNATFKTNPWLERGIMTGITRVSKESIFSDLNNLKVVTTTSDEYADAFGFTEAEVSAAMTELGYVEKDAVKSWYDGFIFGKIQGIYNPWSILNYLDTGKLTIYWANTSSNSLVGKLIREGLPDLKICMEELLAGKHIFAAIDEQIVFHRLDGNENAVWSLLLASGYLKVIHYTLPDVGKKSIYELAITNKETRLMFENMIDDWFAHSGVGYNEFIKALMQGNVRAMNTYMNRIALNTFSYFDTGKHPAEFAEPERFYHGFVLGLIVDLQDRYIVTSNRESGFGRYDVVIEPREISSGRDAIVLEFKVHDSYEEKTLEDTVKAALQQIEDMQYDAELMERGIAKERIRHYGFAFEGKKVLIG